MLREIIVPLTAIETRSAVGIVGRRRHPSAFEFENNGRDFCPTKLLS